MAALAPLSSAGSDHLILHQLALCRDRKSTSAG
jgi:hypothetical protein